MKSEAKSLRDGIHGGGGQVGGTENGEDGSAVVSELGNSFISLLHLSSILQLFQVFIFQINF